MNDLLRWERPEGALAYESAGSGSRGWLVCLPGMGDLRQQFRLLVPALVEAGWGVVSVDLRGHGDSDLMADGHAPQLVGADVLGLLDHLHLDRAVIVGNSAAAASAVWLAVEAPERVAGLALLGPVARNPPSFSPWMARLLRAVFLPLWGRWAWMAFYRSLYKGGVPVDHEEHLAAVSANASSKARRRALLDNGMSDKTPCSDRIPAVTAPSLIVMGAADPDFPDAAAEAHALAQALGGQAVVLDGVGHYPHLEQPGRTIEAVLAWLRGL